MENQELLEKINDWKESVLNNYLNKKGKDKISSNEIDHVVDWMMSPEAKKYQNRLYRISVPSALNHAERWTEKLNKKAAKILKNNRDKDGLIIKKEFEGGYKIVELQSKEAYAKEGSEMGHCVFSYFGRKTAVIFSLRDKNNEPHCTIEFDPQNMKVRQIKGKGNKEVHPKYRPYIISFLSDSDALVWEEICQYELDNIDAIVFGNIVLDNRMPIVNIVTDGDLETHNQCWNNTVLQSLHVKGDLTIVNLHQCVRLAKEIIVEGDLVLEDLPSTLRLADKIHVKGDVAVISCDKLKCLAKEEILEGNVLLSELETYCKKPITDGDVEIEEVPKLRRFSK